MADEERTFKSVSLPKNLYERAENLFSKFHYHTRTRYIEDRLRHAIEKDEKKVGGDNGNTDKS